MIAPRDFIYCGIPYEREGRTREGADCVGLALLFLREEMELQVDCSVGAKGEDCEKLLSPFIGATVERGDVIFFRDVRKTHQIAHVAVHLGEGKLLHTLGGCDSRIDNGFKLLGRLGLLPAGIVKWRDAEKLCRALNDPKLGEATAVILFFVGLALSAAAALLAPKLPRFGNKGGRYSDLGLVTQASPEVALADHLGKVTTAGNSIYQQVGAKGETVSDMTLQRVCKLVVLGSGPYQEIDYGTGLRINGVGWADMHWKNGSNLDGFKIDPAQTEAEAMNGSIMGDTYVPSVSLYTGAYGITVPVDVRAHYDRDFPIYGLSGCSYLAFRMINGNKFGTFNVTCRVKGRKCRTFTSAGFTKTTVTGESLTGADGAKVRFKLAFEDIYSVSSVTVNGTPYAEISASAQTGNVYQLNKTKGFVEFITAPAAAATITITYQYYVRAWTENPAIQCVYLLTENGRGMGFDESRVNWTAASAYRDHCDEDVTWNSAQGVVTEDRFKTGYALDFRKPIQEHLKALLDASNGLLFLSDGKFVLKARKDEASVFSFTQSNILADSFSSEMLDRTGRPNRVKILHQSEDSLNSETEVVADDPVDQRARSSRAGNNGVVEENLKFPAVVTGSQAERLAVQWVRESVSRRWQVELTTTVKGLALEPGDIIDVTHSSQPSWAAKEFRIDELNHDDDDRLVVTASEHVERAFV